MCVCVYVCVHYFTEPWNDVTFLSKYTMYMYIYNMHTVLWDNQWRSINVNQRSISIISFQLTLGIYNYSGVVHVGLKGTSL